MAEFKIDLKQMKINKALMVYEDFKRMGYGARCELHRTNPELYQDLVAIERSQSNAG